MRASRICAFARTIRLAIVGALERNAQRYFFGCQATDFAQGQCQLSLLGQRRMAARKDQAEAVIFEVLLIDVG
jgi:hypothetical protein